MPSIEAARLAEQVSPNASTWLSQAEVLKEENRLLREELDRLKAAQAVEQAAQASTSNESNWQTFEATAYTAECLGCSGFTATGVDVRNTTHYNGARVIATDPSIIPLNTTVELRFSDGTIERAIAIDKGGAIKGNKIDYLVSDYNTAIQFGRQSIELRILEEG